MKKQVETYFKHLKALGVEFVEVKKPPSKSAHADKATAQKPVANDAGPKSAWGTLADLEAEVSKCVDCPLYKTRTRTVFGSGDPKARLMFVGEAPGAEEDAQGLPFVGRAGKLLTKMIEAERALNVPRSSVYIANVLKCRPPGNRPPEAAEIAHCERFLKGQIALIKPSFICALGAHAAHTLLKTGEPIGRLRGRWHEYEGIPLLATYHPSFLLRSPQYKAEAWKDLLMLKEALDGKKVG